MIELVEKLRSWRNDPVSFVRDNFQAEPDKWQLQALNNFRHNKRMAFIASKGVGKTTILSWMIWNFIATRMNSKIACTSISFDNLADGLRSELSYWQNKSKYLTNYFRLGKTRIECIEEGNNWFVSFRSWSKSSNKEEQALTLAGLHADYIMFVCDEAGSYPEAIIATAEAALASGKEVKLILVGNPTDRNGPLHRIATKDKKNWYIQHINSDPENPDRSPRVSIEWAQKQIDTYGRDSAWVKVNVLGEFPDQGSNTLFNTIEVEKAATRMPIDKNYEQFQKRIGVDVARFGDDSTVIFPRQGIMAFNPMIIREGRTQEIISRLTLSMDKWNCNQVFVDGTGGYGSGVCDSLVGLGYAPEEIHFGSKASDKRFFNIRSQMYWNLNEWIKKGGCIPNIRELKEDLLAHTFSYNPKGQFVLEPKEKVKEVLGRSPDYSDALALTFFTPDIYANSLLNQMNTNTKVKTEYDPLAY